MLPITGYADTYSLQAGETIAFKISAKGAATYEASLVRLINGDPNPAGPGIKEEAINADFAGSYAGREQTVPLGSYITVPSDAVFDCPDGFTLSALIWPTLPGDGEQAVISRRDDNGRGFALSIGPDGAACALGNARVAVGKALRVRAWYRVWARFDGESGKLTVAQQALAPAVGIDDSGLAESDGAASIATGAELRIAAGGGTTPAQHFNGKIEAPKVFARALSDSEIPGAISGRRVDGLAAAWDFAQAISSTQAVDTGPHGLHGELVNLPARAMKGARWSGREMCWRHAPEEYAAIHFHDDDIYDCGWETDFTYTVPSELKSGIYAAKLSVAGAVDHIAFFVRPPTGQPTAKLAVLIPTFTYIIYGNMARRQTNADYRARAEAWGARPWTADDHPDYGLSTYNYHRDGSGICHASRLRPMITMRPGFLAFVDPDGSGLRHLPADLQLIDWLEAKGHGYDILTDEDLHREGADLLAPYAAVMTTSHPEYHSAETLDAIAAYTGGGGRLMYLGGNGFYWRVAKHAELDGVVEIRRGEGGIRVWAAEPGEYFNAFDGAYGGLWRRNGRPPQMICGVGFSSQGDFEGSYYRRRPEADDAEVAWMFDGIEDEILGDFGLGGGGAAGFELDRADPALGTPANAIIVATSENHSASHVLVPEEVLTHHSTAAGERPDKLIRADMTYFDTEGGGAVFSVGSITFCGSLSHDNYDNNISRLVENVLRRFRDGNA